MKEFIFELDEGKALILAGEILGCESARFQLTRPVRGELTIGTRRFPLTENGAVLHATGLENGIQTPVFFVGNRRYEGPPFYIGGGTIQLLPPSKDECIALEKAQKRAEARIVALERRIAALETRLTDTHIF